MAIAELTLLGGFELRLAGGDAADLPGQKDRALLAVLALPAGAIHSRDKLANLLWSDRGDQQARDSLKHSLAKLRQCLPAADPSPIVADRLSARLDPATITIDVASFERLLKDGTPAALEQAMSLYRGDLLDGIGIRDPAFEEWLLVERQRLRHLFEEALTRQITQSMADGARERAGTAARRLLVLDPLREDACRALMQIHAERGETAQSLKLYEALRERLQAELGVKPAPETTKLYQQAQSRRVQLLSAPVAASGLPHSVENPTAAIKPSLAVLPFTNMSGDRNQAFFADGMTEDLITALSEESFLLSPVPPPLPTRGMRRLSGGSQANWVSGTSSAAAFGSPATRCV
jgi:DNA-binding SARP family transcriptional activator